MPIVVLDGSAQGIKAFHLVAAGTTNLTLLKKGEGRVHGWYIYNAAAAARKVNLHDGALVPVAGIGVWIPLVLPAGSAANVFSDKGIPFGAGLGISTVTDLTDAGTTAVTASDLVLTIFYA